MSQEKKDYVVQVPKDFLNIDRKYDYTVYRKVEEKIFQILVEKDNYFDREKYYNLEDDKISHVYINVKDKIKYQEDIQKYISQIIDNDEISTTAKASLITDIARETVKDLFEAEVTLNELKKVDTILDNSVDFLLSDKSALENMIKVTSHDYYTYTHSIDVSTYCIGFGIFLGLEKEDLKLLGKAGMLHDIGKSYVDREIICKQGKLDEDELITVRKHPDYSYEILKENGETDSRLLEIVLQHHEKINGKGYPQGLKGNEIDDFAKIVAICDIFNALTTKRTYKDRMSTFDALALMYRLMNKELCLNYLEQFVKFLKLR